MRRLVFVLAAACSKTAEPTQPAVRNAADDAGARGDASLIESAGIGTCERDDDCELSTWAPGCCQGTCRSYAINKRELAARTSSEQCDRGPAWPCPPAAPCPADSYHVVAAKCSQGTCVSILQLIAPASIEHGPPRR